MNSEVSIPEKNNLTTVENVTKNILQVFKEQILINKDDIDALNNAKEFAVSSFTDTPQYRPLIVKLSSVLNDGQFPTPDSKFWQCKAESEVHFNELVRNIYKIESLKLDIEEMEYKIQHCQKMLTGSVTSASSCDPIMIEFDCRRLKIKKESMEFELKLIEKNTKYRIEEVTDWCKIATSFAPDCKYDIHNKNKGITESLYKRLEFEISKATDEKAKENFTNQLNTLKRLLFDKAKLNIKN